MYFVDVHVDAFYRCITVRQWPSQPHNTGCVLLGICSIVINGDCWFFGGGVRCIECLSGCRCCCGCCTQMHRHESASAAAAADTGSSSPVNTTPTPPVPSVADTQSASSLAGAAAAGPQSQQTLADSDDLAVADIPSTSTSEMSVDDRKERWHCHYYQLNVDCC